MHILLVRDDLGGKFVIIHDGLQSPKCILTAFEFERLVAEYNKQKATFASPNNSQLQIPDNGN